MSTIDLTYTVALPASWSATGCDDARAMQRPTPQSPPRSSLSPTATGAATSPNALTDNRDRLRQAADPTTATRAAAAKSP